MMMPTQPRGVRSARFGPRPVPVDRALPILRLSEPVFGIGVRFSRSVDGSVGKLLVVLQVTENMRLLFE